jgi:hypothetical protein
LTLRNVLVMLAVAALAVFGWIALGPKDTGPEGRLQPTMPRFSRDDVSRLAVRSQGEVLEVRRRAERRESWDVREGTEWVRADTDKVEELLVQLARQSVVNRFTHDEVGDDVAGYGLTQPQAEVELTLAGTDAGEPPLLVRYGRKSLQGESVYVDTGPRTDVWVVSANVFDMLPSLLVQSVRDQRVTDVRMFDVTRVEVVQRGVTTAELERDVSHIWRIKQPFSGFAHPSRFETELKYLVDAKVETFVETGVQDLKKYGLDRPRAELVVHSRHESKPVVLLVGAAVRDDDHASPVFVMEQGTRHVVSVGPRFAEAVFKDPGAYRDTSFSRIGIGGVGLLVKLGGQHYRLQKQGTTWDVTEPARFPAEGAEVERALAAVRQWHTREFRDGADPAEFGISGENLVEVELQSGDRTTLYIGNPAEDGSHVWARRSSHEGEGGVELVDAGPVDRLRGGYLQFRRRLVRDYTEWMLPDLQRLARDRGKGPEGDEVQTVSVKRDVRAERPVWELMDAPGVTGQLDTNAVERLVAALMVVRAEEWLHWSTERKAELGIDPTETLMVTLEFADKGAAPPQGLKQTLHVGRRRADAEGGGYYARFEGEDWAFVLGESYVEKLKQALTPEK